jgi:hypothetical protein
MTSTALENIEAAIENDKTRVVLALKDDETDIPGLTEALRGTTSTLGQKISSSNVCSIVFYGGGYAGWETDDVEQLFHVLATNLHNITKVELEAFIPDIPTIGQLFPLRVLTQLLQGVRLRLESLRINEVVLNGTEQDFQDFVHVVQQLKCLRRCFLQDTVTIMIDMTPKPLDDVLLAVTRLPLLVEMSLETEWACDAGPCTFATLLPVHALCSSPTIVWLSLHIIHPNNSAFVAICECLSTNSTLKILHIIFTEYQEVFPVVVSSSGRAAATEYFQPLAQALQTNNGLKELELEFNTSPQQQLDSVLILIVNGIWKNRNSTLSSVDIQARCDFGAAAQGALLRLMRSNYVLEIFNVFTMDPGGIERTWDPPCQTELDLYTRLNSMGRKDLLLLSNNNDHNSHHHGTTSRERWLAAFAKLSNDLDGLYYYLRMNPSLCHNKELAAQPSPPPHTMKKRQRLLTAVDENPITPTTTSGITREDTAAALGRALAEIERLKKEITDLKAKLAVS